MVIAYYTLSNLLIDLDICLQYSCFLFIFSLVGIVWNIRNFIVTLLCIELMFFAVGLNFVFCSIYMFDMKGQLFMLIIMTTTAAETAICLSLLVLVYRLHTRVTSSTLIMLRG